MDGYISETETNQCGYFSSTNCASMYSINEIRKTQNEHLNIVYKICTVSNCECNANFLTFLGLYHMLFALETIGVS